MVGGSALWAANALSAARQTETSLSRLTSQRRREQRGGEILEVTGLLRSVLEGEACARIRVGVSDGMWNFRRLGPKLEPKEGYE